MSTIRQEQVQNRLVEEVSEMLRRDLKDPRLGFVTVTGAEISRDLKFAKVYISVLGTDDERDQCLDALKRASGFIRGEFTRRAHLRVAPEIVFQADASLTRGARIFELLKQIEQEAPKTPPTVPAETEGEA
jgi:ribosome-binding factor A